MSRSTIWQNKLVRKSVIFLFWAAIWEVAALCVHTDLILAGPVESFLGLLGLFLIPAQGSFQASSSPS
ncbi:MAG: hypothetical protein HXK80_04985 [Lachnospiraceae bacterium]|nr:hypothetical protein [Lachnospiraceae bacterium]